MVGIELAAHGLSVIEVQRDAKGGWNYVQNSSFHWDLLIACGDPNNPSDNAS
jgi:secreted PhoX family phosphatase